MAKMVVIGRSFGGIYSDTLEVSAPCGVYVYFIHSCLRSSNVRFFQHTQHIHRCKRSSTHSCVSKKVDRTCLFFFSLRDPQSTTRCSHAFSVGKWKIRRINIKNNIICQWENKSARVCFSNGFFYNLCGLKNKEKINERKGKKKKLIFTHQHRHRFLAS